MYKYLQINLFTIFFFLFRIYMGHSGICILIKSILEFDIFNIENRNCFELDALAILFKFDDLDRAIEE